jgi:hypothetical protein
MAPSPGPPCADMTAYKASRPNQGPANERTIGTLPKHTLEMHHKDRLISSFNDAAIMTARRLPCGEGDAVTIWPRSTRTIQGSGQVKKCRLVFARATGVLFRGPDCYHESLLSPNA